ncbi:unnamed protein product [Anisakis simplex]|uniref:BPI2 domain-containing protein n=1 Tax=Anisakis simplex TaxID=6269 RepID=A0A0M3K7Q5_ANISI|nr:unnamed protein product [Anisakis simplex]
MQHRILNTQLPPTEDCIPGLPLPGCVAASNIYVSHYPHPPIVRVFPNLPNKIGISVRNLDIGITANVNGHLKLLLPIPLSGIAEIRLCQASLFTELAVEERCDHLAIKVATCKAKIQSVNLHLDCAGTIGKIYNRLLRKVVNEFVRQMIQRRACLYLQDFLDENFNYPYAVPNPMSMIGMAQLFGGVDGFFNTLHVRPTAVLPTCAQSKRCAKAATEPIHKPKSLLSIQQLSPLAANSSTPLGSAIDEQHAIDRAALKNNLNGVLSVQSNSTQTELPTDLIIDRVNASDTANASEEWEQYQFDEQHFNSPISDNERFISSVENVTSEMAIKTLIELLDLTNSTYESTPESYTTLEDIEEMLSSQVNDEMNQKLLHKLSGMTAAGETSQAHQILASLQQIADVVARRSKRSSKVNSVADIGKMKANKIPQEAARAPSIETTAAISETLEQDTNSSLTQTSTQTPTISSQPIPETFYVPLKNSSSEHSVLLNGELGTINKTLVASTNRSRAQGSSAINFAYVNALGSNAGIVPLQNGQACPGCGVLSNGPFEIMKRLIATMDFVRLSDIFLSTRVMGAFATCYDYTIGLKGEFSMCNLDQTPFYAPPIFFPICPQCMSQALISDYTINTLLFHAHRIGAINIHIGPDTPDIGVIMRTTCKGIDPSGVAGGGCLGNFIPVASRFPNKGLAISIRTIQPPAILFDNARCTRMHRTSTVLTANLSNEPNAKAHTVLYNELNASLCNAFSIVNMLFLGCATMEFVANADICVTTTNRCFGGLQLGAVEIQLLMDVCIDTVAGQIVGAGSVRRLSLVERQPTLALHPGTLDRIATLGSELITKVAFSHNSN